MATIPYDQQNQRAQARTYRRGMNENVSLGRIAGIHVGFNWSLLVVAALIAWSLATSLLPSAAPGQPSGAYWAAGVISAIVFLASATLSWLGYINISLGVFNLVPAFPLDGGRLLQSLIWLRTGDRLRATRIAARIGMGFAYLLIAYGLATFVFAGSLIGGVWSVFLGWFLLSAARSEEAGGLIRQALSGISVRDVMTSNPVQAPDNISVDDARHGYVLA